MATPIVSAFLSMTRFIRMLANSLGNLVIITSESSFPVQDATTLTGESGKQYFVVFPFTTDKQFIGADCSIRGLLTSIAFWTYTGTGAAVQNTTGARVDITSIRIDHPNGSGLLVNGDNDGNTTDAASRMNVRRYVSVGKTAVDIQGGGAFVIDEATLAGNGSTTDVINVNSTNMLVFSAQRLLVANVPASSAAINLNSSTSEEYEISNIIYRGDSAGHAMRGLPNSGNTLTGGKMTVRDCNFSASTSPLAGGIAVNDVRNFFEDNPPLNNSQIGIFIYLTTPTSLSVAAQDTFYPVSGVCASTISGKWSASGCTAAYLGETPVFVQIDAITTSDTGGNRDISIGVLKNGSLVTGTDVKYRSNQLTPASTLGYLLVEQGDQIDVGLANNSGTQDFSNIESVILRIYKG